jgi:hypothetical protein
MGTLAQDSAGNLLLGYNEASTVDAGNLYPSIFVAGRAAADPPGSLQAESAVAIGKTAPQVSYYFANYPWGAYADMVVDPVDDCTFWYTAELPGAFATRNAWGWSAVVSVFRFPSCIPVSSYVVTGPASGTIAGAAAQVSVSAVDNEGAVVSSFSGTAQLTSTDPQATPVTVTIASGQGTASVVLHAAGTQTLSAVDGANPLLQGTGSITVAAGPIAGYALDGWPTTTVAGQTLLFTARALDSSGNTVPAYNGVALLSTDDPRLTLPGNPTFTQGVSAPFALAFTRSGTSALALTDTQAPLVTTTFHLTVTPGAVTQYSFAGLTGTVRAGAPFNFQLLAVDAFGNTAEGYAGSAALVSSDAKGALPATAAFASGQTQSLSATLRTAGPQVLSASESPDGGLSGATTVFVRSGCGCLAAGEGFEACALLALLALGSRRRRSM